METDISLVIINVVTCQFVFMSCIMYVPESLLHDISSLIRVGYNVEGLETINLEYSCMKINQRILSSLMQK